MLEKAFATDDYTKEDLLYIADVFDFVSSRTIWNTFDSCNNYKLPKPNQNPTSSFTTSIEYWYGEKEKDERKKDFAFMKKNYPNVKFVEMKGLGHAGMATLRPEEFAERIRQLVD